MLKRVCFVLALASVFVLVIPSAVAQDDALPTLADLETDVWTSIAPGGDTVCSNNTPYQFFVRPADPERVLIFLNGGGACWFGQICDVSGGQITYVPFAELPQNSPEDGGGIFDLANPENPFADYSMVFLPYCTADVHLGGGETVYEIPASGDKPAREVTILHNGFANAMSALDWVFDNFDAPDQIFVTGSSAGAIPSPLYTGIIAEQYPEAAIVQLGDGAGGYRSSQSHVVFDAWHTLDILPDWPELAAETADTLTFEDLYVAAAQRYPNVAFAQYNTAEDEVQYGFLALLGETDISLPDKLAANLADITAVVDNFHYFTAGGPVHTILRLPQFYTFAANGVRIRDWVAALASGEPVEDVVCQVCDAAEEVGGGS
ncbi:MAG: vtpJ-therm [Chloroflexota bacterium]|nr:MAG: vtpJ-therm [Chloroflexota bacterium]